MDLIPSCGHEDKLNVCNSPQEDVICVDKPEVVVIPDEPEESKNYLTCYLLT